MKHYVRQFLNTEEQGGTAFIEVTVGEVDTTHSGEKFVDADITIADCSRKVTLDFSVYDKEALENNLTKLRRLRLAIQRFERSLLDAYNKIERSY